MIIHLPHHKVFVLKWYALILISTLSITFYLDTWRRGRTILRSEHHGEGQIYRGHMSVCGFIFGGYERRTKTLNDQRGSNIILHITSRFRQAQKVSCYFKTSSAIFVANHSTIVSQLFLIRCSGMAFILQYPALIR